MMELKPPISPAAALRQHADPPGLWLVVVGSSVLLNSAIALLLHDYFHRLETAAIAPAPIAIALISSGTGKAAPPPSNSASAPRPAPPAAATAPSPKLVLAKPVLAKPVLAKPAKPQTPRPAVSPALPTRFEARPADLEPTPNSESANSDRSQAERSDPESMGDRPSLRDTALSTAPEPSPPPPTTPDEQVATSGRLLPGFETPPDPSAPPPQPTAMPPTIALNRSIPPLEVVLQVTLGDRAQLPAQQFKTFISGEAGCIVTPDALHSFNQPLEFTLALDAQGTITATRFANDTNHRVDNPSYAALAECFLRTLTFPPGESSSPASPTPRVTVILQKR